MVAARNRSFTLFSYAWRMHCDRAGAAEGQFHADAAGTGEGDRGVQLAGGT